MSDKPIEVWIVICGCGGSDPWIDSVWSTELAAEIRRQRIGIAAPRAGVDWVSIHNFEVQGEPAPLLGEIAEQLRALKARGVTRSALIYVVYQVWPEGGRGE